MQDRYVADIGDYVKLAILRKLSAEKRLGVAWWLHLDEGRNNDGAHREYLERSEEWRQFDPELFDALLAINKLQRRSVNALEDPTILPNAVFARDLVPCDGPFLRRPARRDNWLLEIKAQFEHCDLIFLDPDNGIASDRVKPTQKRAGKSVLLRDIEQLRLHGQAMVIYHHQTMRKGGHKSELSALANNFKKNGFHVCGALRARPWSPRAFFILDGDEELCDRAHTIAKTWADKLVWYPEADLFEKDSS